VSLFDSLCLRLSRLEVDYQTHNNKTVCVFVVYDVLEYDRFKIDKPWTKQINAMRLLSNVFFFDYVRGSGSCWLSVCLSVCPAVRLSAIFVGVLYWVVCFLLEFWLMTNDYSEYV
jgi:hypothetical protein